ncbi:putative 30S ribosomal protein S18 alanine acetyltransferase [Magnetofaba australis IT-1]|uniref:[Ribosomal protein bS18]-alanine N-acetyltransferase n=2 Tax=Magnetofaba TaxID=1472292 RepID=A0A1Y2K5E7_9PROT|nr:putative 30S ribosomal protein S18 alanine acetyltransferase [Magnetofaba australis IT-1]
MSVDDAESLARLDYAVSKRPWTAAMFIDELNQGAAALVLTDADERLCGFGVARPLFDEWHVMSVGVAPQLRRQGWGARLMAELIEIARSQEGAAMLLEVRDANHAARALYEKLGFAVIGVRKGYYPDKHNPEDAIVMRLDLELSS